MAKNLVQIIVLGAQVFGRAFARSLQQELKANKENVRKAGGGQRGSRHTEENLKSGLTLQEAQQILNISKLDAEEIKQKYEHLFNANDKSKGGSFYLQSKVVRAKERIDKELEILKTEQSEKRSSQQAE